MLLVQEPHLGTGCSPWRTPPTWVNAHSYVLHKLVFRPQRRTARWELWVLSAGSMTKQREGEGQWQAQSSPSAVTQDISRATSWVIHTCVFEKPWLTGFGRWAVLTKPLRRVAGKGSRAAESQASGSRMDWGLQGSWRARSWTGEKREMLRGWRKTKVSEAWKWKLREGACGPLFTISDKLPSALG